MEGTKGMKVSELVEHLRQLDQGKELLAKFGNEWYEINLSLLPCPDWPEYFVRIEALSPKTKDGY